MTEEQQGSRIDSRRRLVCALALFAGLAGVWLSLAGPQAQAKKASGSLTTLFDRNNNNAGVTFDLEVLARGGIVVKRFDANITATDENDLTGPIQVWTRPGTAEGFADSATGWTSRGSADVTAQGENERTPVPISFRLPQGEYGVAFGAPGSDPDLNVHYTNGSETFENGDLRLVSGRGLDAPIFSDEGGPRIWNGTIYYRVPCEAAKKKLKKAKKQVKKAKRKLANAVDAGDAQDVAVAEQKLEQKQKTQKKAKRKKKRACS
jgi:hypothetical protein